MNLTPVQRQKRALQSPFLRRAYDAYAASFRGNLNYVYSGVNALALLLIELSLGDIHDAEWKVVSSGYDARVERRKEAERLTAVLGYAIDCERQRLEGENQIDFWFYSLRATFLVLTSDDPRKVAQAYREAVAYAPKYTEESMRRGLDMYQTLEADHFNPAINTQENINAALDVISGEEGQRTARNVLLFAGLRMPPLNGSHDNQVMRYLPAAAEDWAREKIIECVQSEQDKLKAKAQARTPPPVSKSQREASLEQEVGDQHDSQRLGRLNRELTRLRDMRLREERARATDPELVGMAAGSSGGDILFHEVCHDLKVATQMYMALPRDQYVGKYVSEAGPRWVERFHAVHTRLKNARPDASEVEAAIQILADTDELPRWLQSLDNYSIGRRTEVWMLQHALVQRSIYGPDTEVTLVVLWAEKRAIAGGLNLLIDLAARNGVKVLTIDCSEWDREGPPVAAAAAAAGADSGGARVTPR